MNEVQVQFDSIRFNILGGTAFVKKETGSENRLNLSPIEFRILLFILRSPDYIANREQIVNTVWNGDVVQERVIDKHVCSLRKKLKEHDLNIKSISCVGYRFLKSSCEE